jgi:prevent-host-death family protein
MTTVSIRDAKNRLTELARQVENGETIVVTRNGRPAFDLVPHKPRKGLRLEAIDEFKSRCRKIFSLTLCRQTHESIIGYSYSVGYYRAATGQVYAGHSKPARRFDG